METIDRISVLIAAYKNADLVRRCLASLRDSFGGRLPEVVLVDDAVGDPEMAQVARDFGVRFVVMPENRGFAGANNAGWPLCTKEYPVLVNSDIVFRDEPFSALLAFMDSHPEAGIVQGTIVIKNGQRGVDGKLNGCGSYLTPLGILNPVGWLADAADPVSKEVRRCFAAYGAMFMVRRAVVESTGRLFYDFFHSYYEEVDFCHRAQLAGWGVYYLPTPTIEHQHGATTWKYVAHADIMKRYYRNIRFSFSTCFGLRGRLLVRPVFEMVCFAQTFVQLCRGNGAAWRAHRWAKRELKALRPTIAEERARIQGYRRISDRELFRVVMKHFPLKDFFQKVRTHT